MSKNKDEECKFTVHKNCEINKLYKYFQQKMYDYLQSETTEDEKKNIKDNYDNIFKDVDKNKKSLLSKDLLFAFIKKKTKDIYHNNVTLYSNILKSEKFKNKNTDVMDDQESKSDESDDKDKKFTKYFTDNYDKSSSSISYTINIIAFQKKYIYYLIYIASILIDYNEDEYTNDNIVINICCDNETYEKHLSDHIKYTDSIHDTSAQGYIFKINKNLLSGQGPLIRMIDHLYDITNDKDDSLFKQFYKTLILFLKDNKITINYIVIDNYLAKGIGLKRGIINYHNYLVGKEFNNDDYVSLVVDDNITHIVKNTISDTLDDFNNSIYFMDDSDSETEFPCSETLEPNNIDMKDTIKDIIEKIDKGHELSEDDKQYIYEDKQKIPIYTSKLSNDKESNKKRVKHEEEKDKDTDKMEDQEDEDNKDIKSYASKGQSKKRARDLEYSEYLADTDKLGLSYKFTGRKDKNIKLIEYNKQYNDKSYNFYIDYKNNNELDELDDKSNICTYKTNLVVKANQGDYEERFSKCKFRISILKIYKKLLKRMSVYTNYLIGGIAKGILGANASVNRLCANNGEAVYKLTLQKQKKLWDMNLLYNIFSTRYWEDIPFNKLVGKSSILKLNTYGLRFGHFNIDDNEDYLSSKLIQKDEYKEMVEKFKGLLLENEIKGIDEPHLLTAYYQYILLSLDYTEKDLGIEYTLEGTGKYVIYHYKTDCISKWLKKYITKGKRNYFCKEKKGKNYKMDLDCSSKNKNKNNVEIIKYISVKDIFAKIKTDIPKDLNDYSDYLLIDIDYGFITEIGSTIEELLKEILPPISIELPSSSSEVQIEQKYLKYKKKYLALKLKLLSL